MIRAIITDIEGTTSSLSFVKDVLFPYSRAHLAEFVQRHAQDANVRAILDEVRHTVGKVLSDDQVIAQLIEWIDQDKKITPLKALQGMIWEDGYHRGAFSGHMYEDAVTCLRQWHAQGLLLYVFSSGSVQAQKLLFAHTPFGDLTPLFSGYFDTRNGNKRESAAYAHIAKDIGIATRDCLFLSDIREELDAARAAGMHTYWLVRDGRIEPNAPHRQVASFDAIALPPHRTTDD